MPFHFLMLRYLRVILYSSGTGGVVNTTIQFRPKLSITGRNWRQCTTLRLVDLIWVHTCFFSLPAPIYLACISKATSVSIIVFSDFVFVILCCLCLFFRCECYIFVFIFLI